MILETQFSHARRIIRTITNKARIYSLIYNSFRSWFKLRKNTVLFESHHGQDFFGNPFYIAKYLNSSVDYKNLRIVVAGNKNAIPGINRLPNKNHVKRCSIHSIRYCYWLAVAEYLVCDVTFPVYFSRRKKQKYLNTWHGTPLKTLGRKIVHNPLQLSNTQRNFLHATHILAPNAHVEQTLLKDYMMEHIYKGKLLRYGYPRNDIFFSDRNHNQDKKIPNKLQIAFMPTWRGTLENIKESTKKQIKDLLNILERIEENLDENIHFYVRLHPLLQEKTQLSQYKNISEFPVDREPYDFLNSCDALVTDYSSVMFDYATTGKPIFLFVYDEKEYLNGRDFCISFSSIPFIKIHSIQKLVHNINGLLKNQFQPSSTYKEFVKKYCPFDGRMNIEKICSTFFRAIPSTTDNVYFRPNQAPKKNILIFVGNFWNNGITSSLKNLLSNIDKNKYNIFLWVDKFVGERNALSYFSELDVNINFIPTQNYLSLGIMDILPYLLRIFLYKEFTDIDSFWRRLWKREYRRLFGDVTFDAIIHFTGYERRVAMLMSFSDSKKIIYAHNDMYLENQHRNNFDKRALNFAYLKADKIAVVRKGAMSTYCRHILDIDINDKVRFVPNCLNSNYVKLGQADIFSSVSDENANLDIDKLNINLQRPNMFRFINLGRFSPEKGQFRLIDAFEKVYEIHPNTQLYIVGGHGKEFGNLVDRKSSSPASENIFIIVGSNNPFPLLSKMNAMIFSSFYEGIGLVMYESLALGIPVISTDIPGPSAFLNQGYGLVVENSSQGLVDGMKAAIDGNVPFKPYDFEKHNQDAVKRFYSLIDD